MNIKKRFKDNEDIQKALADAWMNIKVDESKLYQPLEWPKELDEQPYRYVTWVLSQPEYFSFICKEIMNVDIIPTQALILKELWNRKFPMFIACRGFGKSFCLALYSLLRILLMPRRKVIIAGAAFRQSKVVFEYMEAIYNNAPLLRDIIGTQGRNGPRHETDMYRFHINDSTATAIPIGDGSKVRGQRANDLITDEFASVSKEIFETVLAGFAAVKASPSQNVQEEAAIALAKDRGWFDDEAEVFEDIHKENQIIISGTAYYDFNHYCDYWKDYREIICTQGDHKKLARYFQRKSIEANEEIEISPDFNWKDYSIIRVPYELIPKGFMDAAQIARSKATMHSGTYQMEYGACFSKDSKGFYKRKLIEGCVASADNIAKRGWPSWGDEFSTTLKGSQNKSYVFGVDPASEIDNFSIVILELWPEHRRIVYGWTTNKAQHRRELKAGLINEEDYYAYCAKKIRWLMQRFPCERIMLDKQGGGVAIMESLHDPDKIQAGEVPIYEFIDDDKEKEFDTRAGLHIIEAVNFADSTWNNEANHGLRKDLEDKILLFPRFDALELANATGNDKVKGRIYETLEDCMMDIEELKEELATIVMTQTPSGRDKWDTPEIKIAGGKKGRLRKDRYSSLIMANMGARQLLRNPTIDINMPYGGFAGTDVKDEGGELFVGNQWFGDWAKDFYS